MSREGNRRCLTGRRYALDVLARKRDLGKAAHMAAKYHGWPRADRYRAEVIANRAKRDASVENLANHDAACDVCGSAGSG